MNAVNEESYRNVHNPKNNLKLKNTLRNIRYLVKEGTPIDISYVICEDNYKYIEDAVGLAKKLRVKSITFRPKVSSFKRP